MKDSGVVASSTYAASSQPSNTNTINNHRWNHGTEVLNTMTSTEKGRGKNKNVFREDRTFPARSDSLTDGDLTSCLSASVDPPIARVQTVVGTSSACAVGKLLVSRPRIRSFASFGETDLYFPAH